MNRIELLYEPNLSLKNKNKKIKTQPTKSRPWCIGVGLTLVNGAPNSTSATFKKSHKERMMIMNQYDSLKVKGLNSEVRT